MDIDSLSQAIIGSAIEVHRGLGPGLLESAYQHCLARELSLRGIPFERERALRYRVDLLVAGVVLVEVKAVEVL